MNKNDDERQTRWRSEQIVFDRQAEEVAANIGPFHPRIIRRYSTPGRIYSKEFRFKQLGDLRGKAVLDAGCNDGENSVIMGCLGANVTGVDLSPNAIQLAQLRADANGVQGNVRFCCAPLETIDFPNGTFDVVWCHNILHHIIPDLEVVLERLARWTKPDGMIVIYEPVNLSDAFRRLRFLMPIAKHGTPNERPLEKRELDVVLTFLHAPQFRRYALFSRFDRLLLRGAPLETSSWWIRLTIQSLAGLDYVLLSVPFFARLAAGIVILGSPNLHGAARTDVPS